MNTLISNKQLHNGTNSSSSEALGLHADISSPKLKNPSARTLIRKSASHENTSGTGYKRTLSNVQWRKRVAAAMMDYGMDEKLAREFYDCAETPRKSIPSHQKTLPKNADTVWMCSHNHNHDAVLFFGTCDNRGCPDCAARHSARLVARFMDKFVELAFNKSKKRLRKLVFTTPVELTSDTPDKIRAKIQHYADLPRKALELVQAWGAPHGFDWSTDGCVQSYEFGAKGLRLHFHVNQYGAFIPQDVLSGAWEIVTGGEAKVVRIYGFKTKDEKSFRHDVVESLKYTVKFWKVNPHTKEVEYLPPNVMPHLMMTIKGTRRIRAWGVFYGLGKPEKEPFLCEECGHEMVRLGVENWDLWITYGATVDEIKVARGGSLSSRLANKSGKKQLQNANSPPKYSMKVSPMTEKEKFQYEMMDTPTLASICQSLSQEINELKANIRLYGKAHDHYKKWYSRNSEARQKKRFIEKVLKNRQLDMFSKF